MNEKTFAKELEQEFIEAAKEFEHFCMPISLDYIKEHKLNSQTLIKEIENLGLKVELSENVKSIKKQLKKPSIVIFRTTSDL